jgi:hypothetical protein
MIGVDVLNTRLKRFEGAIEKGELLMMVDVGKDRVEEIEQLIKSHHPGSGHRGNGSDDTGVSVSPRRAGSGTKRSGRSPRCAAVCREGRKPEGDIDSFWKRTFNARRSVEAGPTKKDGIFRTFSANGQPARCTASPSTG